MSPLTRVFAAEDSFGGLLFEAVRDAVLVAGHDGEVFDANDAACAIFAAERETLRTLGLAGLADGSDPRLAAFLEEREATGTARGQMRLRRAGGESFEADLVSQAFLTADGEERFLLVIRELTELRRLEGLEHGYRSLFQSAYDGIAAFTLDGAIADINEAGAAILGRSREELIGAHFASYVPPESLAGLESLRAAREGGDAAGRHYELTVVAADGTQVPVEITSAALVVSGRTVGITCVMRDLRERVAAAREQAHLEAQLRHAEKLKSLGVLAGGIAHDFNNLLLAVLGHASIARAELAPDSPVQESLAAIETGARRCADLANQMLAYAGRSEVEVRAVDANEQVRELEHLLRASVPHLIELRLELGDGLPRVLADPAQLRQVLLNLITNAADAIGAEPGTVTLSTRHRVVPASERAVGVLGESIDPGEYVEIRVEDTGTGMDEETQRRIFEPFFTTKPTGHGLGLAAAAGIVRSHRGAIELHSALGEGSSFRILLPSAVEAEAAEQQTVPLTEGGGVVLVIDDDEQVTAVTRRMLEYFGYAVLTAASGHEGIALAAGDPTIGAVVLDLTMPGGSGLDAFESIRDVRPELPVLLMSGYSEAAAPVPGTASFIQKPFSADELVQRLQATIVQAAGR